MKMAPDELPFSSGEEVLVRRNDAPISQDLAAAQMQIDTRARQYIIAAHGEVLSQSAAPGMRHYPE